MTHATATRELMADDPACRGGLLHYCRHRHTPPPPLNTRAAAARELMAEDPAVVADRTSLLDTERRLRAALTVLNAPRARDI